MDTKKYGDVTLRCLDHPVLDQLIRDAAPTAQRAFAIACARLAASLARNELKPEIKRQFQEHFEIADLLVAGTDLREPRIAAARAAAFATMNALDQAQLAISDRIDHDAEHGGPSRSEHPLAPAYSLAFNCFAAGSAVAHALHEDPLEAAAQCAYELHAVFGVDHPTLLAIARSVLAPV
jgi:hypothetical protein